MAPTARVLSHGLLRHLGAPPRRIWVGVALLVAYVAAMVLGVFFPPFRETVLFPATAIAIAMLFLEGIRLWPFVFLAAVVGTLVVGAPLGSLLVMPVAHTVTASLGAYVMRRKRIDPLFRSTRDMVWFIGTAAAISILVPSFGSLAYYLNIFLGETIPGSMAWGAWYIATFFSIFTISPFLMRWLVKPRFVRQPIEILEILAAFTALSVVLVFLSFTAEQTLGSVPLLYLLLFPLFWISLRLRPRFITLALLLVATTSVVGTFIGQEGTAPALVESQLFQVQLLVITLGLIFYILSAVEEERRVTHNLMRSQVNTLQNAVARIGSESRAKNDFIAVLAHELRNPLAPIANAIELLKERGATSEDDRKMFSVMDDRMHTVRQLLDDLLDVSRIAENKIRLQKETLDLKYSIERAVDSVAHQFTERHQHLAVQFPPEPVAVEADPLRLEQVITNLLTNASKYSLTGGRVQLTVALGETTATIVVEDRGIGIPKELLDKIFEPFRQGESEQAQKGLGIGLALVKNFVEMHGGTVRAHSAGLGKGSVFSVSLPRSQKKLEKKRDGVKRFFKHVPNTVQGPRVLVVDDNDAAAWGVGKLLQLRGAQVEYAYTGDQALGRIREGAYGTIILDIGLPDRDGFAVARLLRQAGFTGTLIALSGYSLEEDRTPQEAGFDAYLIKPVGLSELAQAIPGLRRAEA